MTHTAIILAVAVLWAGLLAAQALPFHTESALTTAFEERGLRTVFEVTRRDEVTMGTSRFVVLPFAPHQRVTTAVAVPLIYKRSTAADARYTNLGLGDVILMAKWAFFARDRFAGTSRLAFVATARLPTGTTAATLDDGTPAPRPLQLGTGAFAGGVMVVGTLVRDRWGVTVDIGRTHSATNDSYRFGGVTTYDVAIGLRFPRYVETIRTKTLQLYLEWNGTVSARDLQNGLPFENSGGHVAYVSPGTQWVLLPRLLIEGSVQVPVIQDLNGTQPDFGLRAAFGTRYMFF